MSWGFAADQPDGAQRARTRALLPGRKIKPLAGETRPFAECVEDRGKHEGSRHAQVRDDCPGHPEPHRGRRPRAQRQATDGKRAFEILTEKGLIASKRGSGTYVKNTTELFDTGGVDPLLVGKDGTREDTFGFTRPDQPIGFTASHSARGRSVSSVVYDFSVTNPPESVARHLSISPDDFTYYFCRVRCLEDDPITIEYTYMPIDVTPGLKRDQLYHSVYSFVQDTLGLKISSFHRIIRAVGATEEEAARLRLDAGTPLLEISQVGFLDDGTPFEFSVARSNGMRSELRDVNVI